MGPALLESEARSRHKVTNCPRYQDFVGCGDGPNSRSNMHGDATELFADYLALSSGNTRANGMPGVGTF